MRRPQVHQACTLEGPRPAAWLSGLSPDTGPGISCSGASASVGFVRQGRQCASRTLSVWGCPPPASVPAWWQRQCPSSSLAAESLQVSPQDHDFLKSGPPKLNSQHPGSQEGSRITPPLDTPHLCTSENSCFRDHVLEPPGRLAPFVSLFTKLRTLHPGSLDDSPVGRDLTQSLPSAEASAPCLPEVPGVSLHEGRRWRVPRGHVDASTLWWLGPHPSPPFSHTPRRSLGKSCKHEKIPDERTRSCYSNSPLIVLMRPPPIPEG